MLWSFSGGSVIFWNVPELERDNVITFIKGVENDGYDEETIHEESELLNFKSEQDLKNARLKQGQILLPKYVPKTEELDTEKEQK